jgi:hypothetical protein
VGVGVGVGHTHTPHTHTHTHLHTHTNYSSYRGNMVERAEAVFPGNQGLLVPASRRVGIWGGYLAGNTARESSPFITGN